MNNIALNRRQFFSFIRNGKKHAIRPPWSLDEEEFQNACTRCGDCIKVCPEHILLAEPLNGFPKIDFNSGECTFCRQCLLACPTSALDVSASEPWQLSVHIEESCLPKQQVICMTCAEQCEAEAIQFRPLLTTGSASSIPLPEIDNDKCTGCGACVATCPVQAIEVC